MIAGKNSAEKDVLFPNESHHGISCAVRIGWGAPEFIRENRMYRNVIDLAETPPKYFGLNAARRRILLSGYHVFV